MSACARPDGAAHADLARPLEHRGQHDVHDADAADQQRDAGDAAHHDVEQALRLPALLEQRLGHHQLVVVGAAVQARRAGRGSRRGRRVRLVSASARTTISSSGERPADRGRTCAARWSPGGRSRAPCPGMRTPSKVRGRPPGGQHADDLEPDVVDLDVAAERRAVAEEVAPHAGADHGTPGRAAPRRAGRGSGPRPSAQVRQLALAVGDAVDAGASVLVPAASTL